MKAKFVLVIGGYAAATFGAVASSTSTGIDPLDAMLGMAAVIASVGFVVPSLSGSPGWRIAARLAVAFGLLAVMASIATPWICWLEFLLIAAAAVGIEGEMTREKIPFRNRPHMAAFALFLAMGAAVFLLNALPGWEHDPEGLFRLKAFYAVFLYGLAFVLPWLMAFAYSHLSRNDST